MHVSVIPRWVPLRPPSFPPPWDRPRRVCLSPLSVCPRHSGPLIPLLLSATVKRLNCKWTSNRSNWGKSFGLRFADDGHREPNTWETSVPVTGLSGCLVRYDAARRT